MPVLHNRISNDALKAKMLAESEPRTTISFYKYFHIADPKATRDALYQLFTALDVFGRVYLAHEGINAQISVPASNVETFRAQLYAFDPALEGIRLNIALDDDGKSFWVLRMKVRDRIVADGIDDPHFDASNVGEYLQAAEVNAMLDDPDALRRQPLNRQRTSGKRRLNQAGFFSFFILHSQMTTFPACASECRLYR